MLNQKLYDILCHKFHQEPKVYNHGQPMTYVKHPTYKRANITGWGETYNLSCPYCGDKRNRLSISHCYGTKDPISDYPIYSAAICYNERCDLYPLREALTSKFGRNIEMTIGKAPQKECGDRKVEVEGMGDHVPLVELGDDHFAVEYMLNRGFSKEVMRKYNLRFIVNHEKPWVSRRIAFPIYYRGELVGWTARFIGDNKKMKWVHAKGTKSHDHLYNFDYAVNWTDKPSWIMLVEGPMDVLAIGEPAMAMFGKGKRLSMAQKEKLGAFRGRPIILCLDSEPEAQKDAKELKRDLLKDFSHVYNLVLPSGKDPGDIGREGMWTIINKFISDQNIPIL